MLGFCTYFNSDYLVRFLAMFESLQQYAPSGFHLYALCFDDEALRVLETLGLSGVTPIPLSDFERDDLALKEAKQNRSVIEYFFTCTPSLLLYVFRNFSCIDRLVYLDADLFFFSSLAPVLDECEGADIGVIPHRHTGPWLQYADRGRFNVAFMPFRRTSNGLECLEWWRARCLEWCYDRHEADRFADQKYLDKWPDLFDGVHVIQHKGANVAPWNVERYHVHSHEGEVCVDDTPLVFYHFEGYRQITRHLMDSRFSVLGSRVHRDVVKLIHFPYINMIARQRRILSKCGGADVVGFGNTRHPADTASGLSMAYRIRSILNGRYIAYALGRCWYCDSPLLRKMLETYDKAIKGRGGCGS